LALIATTKDDSQLALHILGIICKEGNFKWWTGQWLVPCCWCSCCWQSELVFLLHR